LLFAIDAKLKIADGFRYVTDCRLTGAATHDDSGSGHPLWRRGGCGGD
jgi:hypothetical protein